MQTMANSPVTHGASILTTELIDILGKLIHKGSAEVAFQVAMGYCKAYDDFDDDWTPEEREAVRQDMIEAVKRQIGEVIKSQYKHCGQAVGVKGIYDFETQQHSLLVK